MNENYFEELFGGPMSKEEFAAMEARMEQERKKSADRLAKIAQDQKDEKTRLRCPKCCGAGRLSQFMHRNGGECFQCGGSGVFAAYC